MTVRITVPRDNRAEEILRDPDGYFEVARKREYEAVVKDIGRERLRRSRGLIVKR